MSRALKQIYSQHTPLKKKNSSQVHVYIVYIKNIFSDEKRLYLDAVL
jgi:hypothetical protein